MILYIYIYHNGTCKVIKYTYIVRAMRWCFNWKLIKRVSGRRSSECHSSVAAPASSGYYRYLWIVCAGFLVSSHIIIIIILLAAAKGSPSPSSPNGFDVIIIKYLSTVNCKVRSAGHWAAV